MELSLREARARLSELVAAARAIVTRHGGIDFDRLEKTRRRLGIEDGDGWPEAFDDPAFSRRVLCLDDE